MEPKVHNEMGFALMAVNIRKYTAINKENGTFSLEDIRKNACAYLCVINTSLNYSQLHDSSSQITVLSSCIDIMLIHFINEKRIHFC